MDSTSVRHLVSKFEVISITNDRDRVFLNVPLFFINLCSKYCNYANYAKKII